MNSALFLDRDGVIIEDAGYLKDASQVALISGIEELLSRAQDLGFRNVVVTNQSGVGRGWISLQNYRDVSQAMLGLLHQKRRLIDGIYFCPFFAAAPPEILSAFAQNQELQFETQHVPQQGRWDVNWRKPAAGMLEEASRQYSLNPKTSVMVGDRATDVRAAFSAGLGQFFWKKSEVFAAERLELEAWLNESPAHQKWFLASVRPIESYTEVELA